MRILVEAGFLTESNAVDLLAMQQRIRRAVVDPEIVEPETAVGDLQAQCRCGQQDDDRDERALFAGHGATMDVGSPGR